MRIEPVACFAPPNDAVDPQAPSMESAVETPVDALPDPLPNPYRDADDGRGDGEHSNELLPNPYDEPTGSARNAPPTDLPALNPYR